MPFAYEKLARLLYCDYGHVRAVFRAGCPCLYRYYNGMAVLLLERTHDDTSSYEGHRQAKGSTSIDKGPPTMEMSDGA